MSRNEPAASCRSGWPGSTLALVLFTLETFALQPFFTRFAEGLGGESLNAFFHFGAGLEGNHFLCRKHHGVTGVWIASLFGSAVPDLKDTELSQLNSAVSDKATDDRVERFLHRCLGKRLGDVQRFGDFFCDFFFRLHVRPQ